MNTSVTLGALEQTKCLPSDHAGLVVEVSFVASDISSRTYPASHTPFPIGFWKGSGIALVLFLIWRIRRRVTTSRALKAV